MGRTNDTSPTLLTPGPLTTSAETKAAMQGDWGSRDETFLAIDRRVRRRLLEIAHATETHVCVPLQGSGTFAIEAALGTFVPPHGAMLVLVNGAYGRRIVHILETLGRRCVIEETAEDCPPDLERLDTVLAADPTLTHVAVVHCETTSGILNPVADVARVVAHHNRRLVIDAMSAFGGIPLDAREVFFDVLIASSNKCLEGVPGLGFVLARTEHLAKSAGNAHSVCLDLHAQWRGFETRGQWRFTPPTHVIVALDRALEQHAAEGGVLGRYRRYQRNCEILVQGMETLGFTPYVPAAHQAPIIVTFPIPDHPQFDFQAFYDGLCARGFLIYPGKLTQQDSFRIGCIGHIDAPLMKQAVEAIRDTLAAFTFQVDTPPIPSLPSNSWSTHMNSPGNFCGPLKAVILDWAGTTIDYGCCAPVVAFIEAYRRHGVEITKEEARAPMGTHKRVHIQQIGQLPSVVEKWHSAHGRAITEDDIDSIFEAFIPLQLSCLADHAELIPGTLETVQHLRECGLKIGSTTGYTGQIMELLENEARIRGYVPDSTVCATDVPAGRPEPWMCVQNAMNLGIYPFASIVKVDDTLPGISEGLNAGMWTIGLAMSGNEVGLSEAEIAALSPEVREQKRERAYRRMRAAGAHYVVDSIADLPAIIDDINERLARGENPIHGLTPSWWVGQGSSLGEAAPVAES